MKVRRTFWVLMLAGAVVWLPLRGAHAAGYQCDITNDTAPAKTATNTVGKGQIKIAPSKKKGDGGATIQLNVKGVSCGTKCNNNVIDLGVRAIGTDVPSAAGILFNVAGGKTVFANGKNKEPLGGLFGALASVVFGNSLGIGLISLREPASNPSDCSQVPLATGNHCTDGAIYAVAGFLVPVDPSLLCSTDTDCGTVNLTEACDQTTHLCMIQQCTDSSECRSGMCNINSGQCCQNGIGAGCP
jgi:hypothetical protein